MNTSKRVVVTGIGTVNSLGNDVATTWAKVKNGDNGIGPITKFDVKEGLFASFSTKIAGEVRDRFGPWPDPFRHLMEVMKFKLFLKRTGVRRIGADRDRVILSFDSRSPIDPQRIVQAIEKGVGRIDFTPDQRLRLRLKGKNWIERMEEAKSLLLELI